MGTTPLRSRAAPLGTAEPASSPEDWLLGVADAYLDRALQLRAQLQGPRATRGYDEVFDLTPAPDPSNASYGYFHKATIDGRTLPVMGNVQEMFFDRARSPHEAFSQRRQLREFVLRYFMRVSDFRILDAYAADDHPAPTRWPEPLSWCSRSREDRIGGFGFSQVFAKRAGSGSIRRFAADERDAIIDLREIGSTFDWLIAKVQIFNFAFRFTLPGVRLEVVLPLEEESYLVLSPDFVLDDPQRGRFGLGYAFVRNPTSGVLAYGPGEFDVAYEQIEYRVDDAGRVRVRMDFAANRPTSIVSMSLDPFAWAARTVNLATVGLFAPFVRGWETAYARLRLSWPTIDPVYLFIALANVATLGRAAEEACIEIDQPDRLFLAQHFKQHYQTIAGAIATWRRVADWTDESALPEWVHRGVSPS